MADGRVQRGDAQGAGRPGSRRSARALRPLRLSQRGMQAGPPGRLAGGAQPRHKDRLRRRCAPVRNREHNPVGCLAACVAAEGCSVGAPFQPRAGSLPPARMGCRTSLPCVHRALASARPLGREHTVGDLPAVCLAAEAFHICAPAQSRAQVGRMPGGMPCRQVLGDWRASVAVYWLAGACASRLTHDAAVRAPAVSVVRLAAAKCEADTATVVARPACLHALGISGVLVREQARRVVKAASSRCSLQVLASVLWSAGCVISPSYFACTERASGAPVGQHEMAELAASGRR